MSVRAVLFLFSVLSCFSACVEQDLLVDSGDPAAIEGSLSTERSAATVIGDVPPIAYPSPPVYQYYAENWNPRTSAPLTWPGNATRVQVLIRRGYAPTLFTAGTFFVFIVADGVSLRRVLHVSTNDYSAFLSHINAVYTVAETPNSERSHSIAGGTYVGPHPAGPPGDPISWTLINRVLLSAAAIDDSAQQAINQEF
jgi:hypothetical protein